MYFFKVKKIQNVFETTSDIDVLEIQVNLERGAIPAFILRAVPDGKNKYRAVVRENTTGQGYKRMLASSEKFFDTPEEALYEAKKRLKAYIEGMLLDITREMEKK